MRKIFTRENPQGAQNKLHLFWAPWGFSTIELLIAFSVGISLLSASLMLVFSDTNFNRKLSLETGQNSLLDTIISTDFRKINADLFDNLIVSLISNWDTTPTSPTNETTITISDISSCAKTIMSSTNWKIGERTQSSSLTTAAVDKNIATKIGRGNCDSIPASAWLSAESASANELNISGTENPTAIKITSLNGKRYAFITSNPSPGLNKVEFSVVDVSDNNLSNQKIKATLPFNTGLLGLTITPNYIYILTDDVANQIKIIDIHDPENPILLPTTFSLLKITCSFDAQTCQSKSRSIAYYDGYLYIGTGYMAGNSPEFHILCVHDDQVLDCSPTNLVETAQLNINHNINDLTVKDNYAYLATSASYAELTMVDISNKNNLQLPPDYLNPNLNNLKYNARTDLGGSSDEDAFSVFVLGQYVYLGRQHVTSHNEKDFYILDVSEPNNIYAVASTTLGLTGSNSYISKIIINNQTGFIATTDSTASLRILDLADIKNPKQKNFCGKLNTNFGATGLDFRDNQIFLVHGNSNQTLKIFSDNNHACII